MEPHKFSLNHKELSKIDGLSTLEDFRNHISEYIDYTSQINDALEFAYKLHKAQKRDSGQLYITQPVAVLEIIAKKFKVNDQSLLMAALLHDVIEDKSHGVKYFPLLIKDIEDRFGKVTADLVEGCTKLSQQRWSRKALKNYTHKKIFLSASKELGVLVLKLADRLHNMQTLRYLDEKSKNKKSENNKRTDGRKQRIAQETIDIYAPIAAQLNIFPLKRELLDFSMPYFNRKISKKILNSTKELLQSHEVEEIFKKFKNAFSENNNIASVRARIKTLGAYYSPIRGTLSFDHAENRVDFTLIVKTNNVLDCYSVLGITNSLFKPVPKSIRDYISMPKINGYKSIHVRINYKGEKYLIKIRTPEMDILSKYGVLYRWNLENNLNNIFFHEIKRLLRSIGEYGGSSSKRKELILYTGSKEIYVYTPNKEVHNLPVGSIVLDFAYKIHTELGERCEGALVNGEWVSPDHILNDDDTVKVMTSKLPLHVDNRLEELCKTPKARNAVYKKLQKRRRFHAKKIGQEVLI